MNVFIMKRKNISLFLFIIVKLCTVSALCSSALSEDPLIYSVTAEFLYSDGISTKNDAKNYGRLNEAAAGNAKAKQALEKSYQSGCIKSLNVSRIGSSTGYVDDAYMDKLARLHPKATRLYFSRINFSHRDSPYSRLDFKSLATTDDGLKQWLIRFPKVISLSLFNGRYITDAGIIALAEQWKGLREVDLGRCSEITDEGIIALAEHCKELRKISLKYCSKITDKGIISLAQNCKELREVDLQWCSEMTVGDLGVRWFSEITDAAVIALIEYCKELRELDLRCCHNITIATISDLLDVPEKLRISF